MKNATKIDFLMYSNITILLLLLLTKSIKITYMSVNSKIIKAYIRLLNCLEPYKPKFNNQGIEFTCPSFYDDEKSFNVGLCLIAYSLDQENKEFTLKVTNTDIKKVFMNIKYELIKRQQLFDNFNDIVSNGFLQTVNLLVSECNFICFNFPDASRKAYINGPLLNSPQLELQKFRFQKTINVSFKSPVSNIMISVDRKSMYDYFTKNLCTFQIDNTKHVSLDLEKCRFLPNEILIIKSESRPYIFETTCLYKSFEILIKCQFGSICGWCYWYCEYCGIRYNTIELAMEFIDSLETLVDCSENVECDLHKQTGSNKNCMFCVLKRIQKERVMKRKELAEGIRRELIMRGILKEIVNFRGFNTEKQIEVQQVTQRAIQQNTQTDALTYLLENIKNIGNVIKTNASTLELLGPDSLHVRFASGLNLYDRTFLELLAYDKTTNFTLICEILKSGH